jgi:hypothetical protein
MRGDMAETAWGEYGMIDGWCDGQTINKRKRFVEEQGQSFWLAVVTAKKGVQTGLQYNKNRSDKNWRRIKDG